MADNGLVFATTYAQGTIAHCIAFINNNGSE